MNPKYFALTILPSAIAWCTLKVLGHFVSFGAMFPIWVMAPVIGGGCTLIAFFYKREGRLVSQRTKLALIALRCLSFIIVALILTQPVLIHTVTKHIERTVAIVMDVSGSMLFTDDGWNANERLSLAREAGLIDRDSMTLRNLEQFDEMIARVKPWISPNTPGIKLPASFRKLVADIRDSAGSLTDELEKEPFASTTNTIFRAFERQLLTSVIPAIDNAKKLSPSLFESAFQLNSSTDELQNSAAILARLGESLSAAHDNIAEVRREADNLTWNSLTPARRDIITAYTDTNRLFIANSILSTSILPGLSAQYDTKLFAMSRDFSPLTLTQNIKLSDYSFTRESSAATDMTAVLENIMNAVPAEQLAGVLFLTDGIHNGDAAPEPIARQLGAHGVHVSAVLVGSSAPPFDLALADISAPESVFLGDKVRVRATLAATEARGKTAKISLLKDGEKVDETDVQISENDFRREISLTHEPGTNGLARYEIAVENLNGERFASNNVWKVDVAVSDDRTHVLLIDDYPRWDFRYLRNLFYARDKSVHLQYLLLHPDTIEGIDVTNRPPAASAARPFGDAEAGSLPISVDEWRKFDVIIIGDVGPDVITDSVQSNIAECVSDRGALFVSIAGPRAMPHAYPPDSQLSSLLPCTFDATPCGGWNAPEKAFSIMLTPSGRIHPIMQQSNSPAENEQLWRSLPNFTWRFPVKTTRPGAEIIATAAGLGGQDNKDVTATTLANAAEQLETELRNRETAALIVAQNFGRGKVLSLMTDESWRLRYRVGDTRHHRFWGQVIRWGLGERLRDGTQQLRIGTDRMTYTPHDKIRLLARVCTEDFAPVNNAKLKIEIVETGTTTNRSGPRNSVVVPLSLHEKESGLYEAVVPPLTSTGAFTASILEPERYSGEGPERKISTMFFVTSARRPIEMATVSATASTIGHVADLTGGRVVAPHQAKSLCDSFGEPSRVISEPLEIPLWDSPWLFFILAAALSAEWILRKKNGLV